MTMTGSTLSHYRIVEELGRGGMGIVYKAEDTKLDRTVAIKVLPAAALASEEDRGRFYREAKAAAALNHPNIAAIHQIDEAVATNEDGAQIEASDGPRPFIAMEFIEGGTLERRIKAGPLKLAEAVKIATQVAEALRAAHAKDIVHRDIKSANIMLTREGEAKVLDFGLAQTSASTKLTRMGSTLGTVAYMSPEQARGEEVDGRTDLYSLGTVLYEMIAGRLPFGGEYEQAVVYSILNADPEPLTALRTGVPMELERITNKLLAKDAAYRYQTAADLTADLKALEMNASGQSRRSIAAASSAMFATAEAAAEPRTSTRAMPAAPAGAAADRKRSARLLPASLLVVGLLLGWAIAFSVQPEDEPLPLRHYTQYLPGLSDTAWPAISEDGQFLAIGARDTLENEPLLHIWDLRTNERRSIPNSGFPEWPVFSPDSRRVAFISSGKLKIAGLNGDEPVEVASAAREMVQWGDDGSLYFASPALELSRVLPSGRVEKVMPADTLVQNFFPNAVFGDRILLSKNERPGKVSGWSMSLKTGEIRKILDNRAFYLRYVDAGYLVVQSAATGQVSAYPYSKADDEIVGLAQPFLNETTFSEWFVTRSGYLATISNSAAASLEMLTLDEEGRAQRLLDPVLNYEEFQFSPSGSHLIAEINGYENGADQLLLFDLQTGLSRQVTYSDPFFEPTLSPEGDRVAFGSPRNSGQDIGIRRVDGTGETEWITSSEFISGDPDWAPSGNFIVFDRSSNASDYDIWMYSFEDKAEKPLVEEPGAQMYPRVSHGSRYVAYQSNQTRNTEVWVMDLKTGAKTRVSPSGGFRPAWGPDNSVLYYSTGVRLMAVDVATSDGFRVTGQPRSVFEVGAGFYFDVSDQGRIAIAKWLGNPTLVIEIVQNWPETMK